MEGAAAGVWRPALKGTAAVCVLLVASSLPAHLYAADFNTRLQEAFAQLEQSGLAVIAGVAHKGAPTVIREFGTAKNDGIPPARTQLDINSVTKTVTAVMTLKLVEQDGVKLDETLGQIFTSVPADKTGITVHHLLTHAAGFVESVGDDAERLSKAQFLERAFATRLRSKPGRRYHYSNVGFSVLAAIIEQRSGKPYDQYLREDVLGGRHLPDTGYKSVYEDARSLRSTAGETIRTASWGGHEPFWNLVGNGAMISTTADFIQFRQAFVNGQIVDAPLVQRAQVKHIPETRSRSSHYGYGLVVQDHPKLGRIYWHDGGNDIFSAIWIDLADKGDVIFTAAADTPAGGATTALSILISRLYQTKL
jgi:CubicO group peptidase (beta-lactamase class C family)